MAPDVIQPFRSLVDRLLKRGVRKHSSALHAEQLPGAGPLGVLDVIDEAAVGAGFFQEAGDKSLKLGGHTGFYHGVPRYEGLVLPCCLSGVEVPSNLSSPSPVGR